MPDICAKAVDLACLVNVLMKVVCTTQGKGTH